MSDLLERLLGAGHNDLMDEAAHRIEELEACIANQASQITGRHQYVGADYAFRLAEQRRVMQMALEALEAAMSDSDPYIVKSEEAITALRTALGEKE